MVTLTRGFICLVMLVVGYGRDVLLGVLFWCEKEYVEVARVVF